MADKGTTLTARALKVPGATLHYEVRGSGPVLLMIPGGPMDAGGFGPLAEQLAGRYTVVTYDCRGNSRSPLDGPPENLGVEVHADDAHRLLAAVGAEPAYVLGSSGGATYGLDLAARYPDQVKTLVAHEPPVMELLPDSARWRALTQEITAIHKSDGVFPALQRFGEATGLGGGPDGSQEMSPEMIEMMTRTMGNMELFVSHLIPQISGFVPDIDALRAGSTRIVVGVGDESTEEQVPHRAAHALAKRLGTTPVQFPGDHGGFGAHADTFAERLDDVLSET